MEQREFLIGQRSIMSEWERKRKWNTTVFNKFINETCLVGCRFFQSILIFIHIEKKGVRLKCNKNKNRWHTTNLNVFLLVWMSKKLQRLLYFELISLCISFSFISLYFVLEFLISMPPMIMINKTTKHLITIIMKMIRVCRLRPRRYLYFHVNFVDLSPVSPSGPENIIVF